MTSQIKQVMDLNLRIPLSLTRVGCFAITLFLKEDIYDISILINGSPQIMLYTVDLDEYFINKECVTESPAFSLQSFGIFRPELVAEPAP